MKKAIENRVVDYWTARIPEFSKVRKNELTDGLGERWCVALEGLLPSGHPLKILDVGTGTGFFCILLARRGYDMAGIDLTPVMIEEARAQAAAEGLPIRYDLMNAQELSFADESFDAIISRNLTWTLPDPEKAYKEWFRVLKTGGTLINFDANYGSAARASTPKNPGPDAELPYGHTGITTELAIENKEITISMNISREDRPSWDMAVLHRIGFSFCTSDVTAGTAILQERNDPAAPMFLVMARK